MLYVIWKIIVRRYILNMDVDWSVDIDNNVQSIVLQEISVYGFNCVQLDIGGVLKVKPCSYQIFLQGINCWIKKKKKL